jgi:hypothetical protein
LQSRLKNKVQRNDNCTEDDIKEVFRIRSSVLIAELWLALSNVFIRRETYQ